MTLQEKLKTDLKQAIKDNSQAQKDAIRVVLGELARLDQKEIPDDDVVRIVKKLIKSEKELLEKTGQQDSEFIATVETYLPKMADENEIRIWIEKNVDFSTYKNKMKAMGQIMKHFGSSADGNMVKKVLRGI
jgi:uncharacterized protein YqeY